jgi:hypothetical protein
VGEILSVARSFLMLITHASLLDCLSVDSYVGDLYVFISGSSGSRAIPFFQHVCKALNDPATKGKDADQTIMCLVRATREVIIPNQKALYHEGLPGLVGSVSQLCDELMVDKPLMAPTKIQIEELQRLRKLADTMLADNQQEADIDITTALQKVVRPNCPILETPGSLHNNDKGTLLKLRSYRPRIRSVVRKGCFYRQQTLTLRIFCKGQND